MIGSWAKDKISRAVAIFMIIATVLLTIYPSNAYADVESVNIDDMRPSSVLVPITYTSSGPSLQDPIESIETEAGDETLIGFDVLYGTNLRSTYYFGETPSEATNQKYVDEHPTGSINIDGKPRNWSLNPSNTVNDTWSEESVKDLHASPLLNSVGPFKEILSSLSTIPVTLIFTIAGLFDALISLEIFIANLNITEIVTAGTIDNISKTISSVFVGTENGISPLLAIAVIIFVVSLCVNIFKYVTSGQGTVRAIIGEFAMLFLAMIISVMAVNGGLNTIHKQCFDVSNRAVTDIVMNSTDNNPSSLYNWNTGEDHANYDTVKSMQSLIKEPMIELIIRGQFGGLKISDLDITEDNWGLSNSQLKTIVESLTMDKDGNSYAKSDLFVVKTGPGDFSYKGVSSDSIGNLGYYWYASTSNLDPNNPFSVNESSGGEQTIVPNNTTGKGYLYIIDFVSAVAAQGGNVEKCEAIIGNFSSPGVNIGEAVFLIIVMLLEFLAIGFATLFTLLGSVIFNLGILFVPVFPILMIIPKTRELTKKLLTTWMVGLLRYVIGIAFITIVLEITSTFCNLGVQGMAIALAFLFIAFLGGPRIFQAINNGVGRYEVGAMRDATSAYDRMCNSVSGYRNPIKNIAKSRKNRANMAKEIEGQENSKQDSIEDTSHNIVNEFFSNVSNKKQTQSVEEEKGENDNFSIDNFTDEERANIAGFEKEHRDERKRLEEVKQSEWLIKAGASEDSHIVKLHREAERLAEEQERIAQSELNRNKKRFDLENKTAFKLLTSTSVGAFAVDSAMSLKDNIVDKHNQSKLNKLNIRMHDTQEKIRLEEEGDSAQLRITADGMINSAFEANDNKLKRKLEGEKQVSIKRGDREEQEARAAGMPVDRWNNMREMDLDIARGNDEYKASIAARETNEELAKARKERRYSDIPGIIEKRRNNVKAKKVSKVETTVQAPAEGAASSKVVRINYNKEKEDTSQDRRATEEQKSHREEMRRDFDSSRPNNDD